MNYEIKSLLEEVAFNLGAVREAKRRFADRLAPDFNIFDYFRADEIALSSCIADLLDPQGTHGQGSKFLVMFFGKVCQDTNWIRSFENCKVVKEKQANDQRRIDVHLEFSEGIVGIENKPWAIDQYRQLSDYAKYLEESARDNNWLLIYLCNNDPSQESLTTEYRKALEEKEHFIHCSYFKLIDWLDCCRAEARAPSVGIFIEELIKFIRISINGELEMSEEKEVTDVVLASKRNLSAAFDISSAMTSIKSGMLRGFHDNLAKRINDLGFDLVWDESLNSSWKPWSGFGVKFQKEHDFYLRFEFEKVGLGGFYWGIRRERDSVKNENGQWKEISDLMERQLDFSRGENNKWWPWYSTGSINVIGKEVSNWGGIDFLWEEMIEDEGKEISDQIVALAKRVHSASAEKSNIFILRS